MTSGLEKGAATPPGVYASLETTASLPRASTDFTSTRQLLPTRIAPLPRDRGHGCECSRVAHPALRHLPSRPTRARSTIGVQPIEAWIETVAVHLHAPDDIAAGLVLEVADTKEVRRVMWMPVHRSRSMYASHKQWVDAVAAIPWARYGKCR